MTEKEFDETFTTALDTLLETLAENPEIDPHKFYKLALLTENLRFFSPVFYSAILKKKT